MWKRGQSPFSHFQLIIYAVCVTIEFAGSPALPVFMGLEAVQYGDEYEVVVGLQLRHDFHEHMVVEACAAIVFTYYE